MANVDVTLRMTNPALYNNLLSLVNSPHTININAIGISGATVTNFKQQLVSRLGTTPIPITVTPTLGNANRLIQQIQRAIGNVSINVSIGNLAALNTQIANLFAGLGIQANTLNNPPRNTRARGTVRSLGGILASQIRNEENPIDPRLGNVENALGVLSGAPGVEGIRNEEARRRIERARDSVARRQAKNQREFQQKQLFDIALLGPQRAAREFEEEKGLRAGSINAQEINRISFDPARAFNTRGARNELGFSALFGGVGGAIGGVVGGGFFGEGGVFLGSAIFQKAAETIKNTFETITSTLLDAAKAGLEFQTNIASAALVLQSTSKVVDSNGKEVDLSTSFKFQNQRASGLVNNATDKLSPFGVGSDVAATTIRSIVAGGSRNGISFTDKQIEELIRPVAGGTKLTNPDLLQNISRYANDVEDVFAGQTNNEFSKSAVGSIVGPQLRSAIKNGDAEGVVKAFKELDKLIVEMANSSDSASFQIGKVNAEFASLQRGLGDEFTKALVPGIKELAKALDNPSFAAAVKSLGRDIGSLVNIVIAAVASTAQVLAKNPGAVKSAIGVGSGAVAGGTAGLVAGGLVGGIPGALVGGGVGAVVGGIGGGVLASQPIPKANLAPNQSVNSQLSGLKVEPRIKEEQALDIIGRNLNQNADEGSILGKLASSTLNLKKQQVSGSISEGKFNRGVEEARIGASVDLSTTLSKIELSAINLGTAFSTLDLKVQETAATFADFDNSRKLEQLQGTDKLFEIAKQIQEAGGSSPLSLASGFSSFDIGSEDKGKGRKLAILNAQFEQESSKNDPFRFGNQTRVQRAEAAAKNAEAPISGFLDQITQLNSIRDLVKTLPGGSEIDTDKFRGLLGGDASQGRDLSGKVSKEDFLKSIDDTLETKFKDQGITKGLRKIDDVIDSTIGVKGDISLKDLNATIEKLISTLSDTIVNSMARVLP